MSSAPQSVPTLAPFRIEPWLSTRPWGYRELRPWYDYVAEGDPIGEVWLTGDDCLVSTGPHAGKRLASLFAEFSSSLLGARAGARVAAVDQSVICPRETQRASASRRCAGAETGFPRGKTECWYALSAERGAQWPWDSNRAPRSNRSGRKSSTALWNQA